MSKQLTRILVALAVLVAAATPLLLELLDEPEPRPTYVVYLGEADRPSAQPPHRQFVHQAEPSRCDCDCCGGSR